MLKIKIAALLIVSSTLISACQQAPKNAPSASQDNFAPVTESDLSSLAGKKLTLDNNFVVLSEDGAITGTWSNSPVVGTWEMKEGLWCRTYSVFFTSSLVGDEECHLWERDGNMIKGTRKGGKGTSYLLTATDLG